MLSAGSEVTGLAHLTSEAERNADHTLIRRRQFAEPNPSGGSLSDEDLAKLCTLTGATA